MLPLCQADAATGLIGRGITSMVGTVIRSAIIGPRAVPRAPMLPRRRPGPHGDHGCRRAVHGAMERGRQVVRATHRGLLKYPPSMRWLTPRGVTALTVDACDAGKARAGGETDGTLSKAVRLHSV